jgi:hypothetical protein
MKIGGLKIKEFLTILAVVTHRKCFKISDLYAFAPVSNHPVRAVKTPVFALLA